MDINSKKAVIMMATYNGEKYIQDQIESLQNQTFTNWELYISDDNSTDGTLSLLKKLKAKEPRIKTIIKNKSRYHGSYANYFNIMNYVKNNCTYFDYYFYCDQDDIWKRNKLEQEIIALKKIESKYSDSIPAFCYCDLLICDQNCKSTGDKMSNHIRTQFIDNPYNTFFKEQYVWGTTMAHNNAMWDLIYIGDLDQTKNLLTHDGYISRYAATYGKTAYISEPLVLYRRTGNNVSGTPGNYNNLSAIIKRILFKMPVLIDNAANVYWDSLYFAYHAPKNVLLIKEVKQCFHKNIAAHYFMKKYNILVNEKFWGRYSTKTILYLKLYKKSKIFLNNFYGVKK